MNLNRNQQMLVRRGLVEEMGRSLHLKDESIRDAAEMIENNIEPAGEDVSSSVGDAERHERTFSEDLILMAQSTCLPSSNTMLVRHVLQR